MKRSFLIILFLFFLLNFMKAQYVDTTNLKGRWTYCTGTKLDTGFYCKDGWAVFAFDGKGNFLETQGFKGKRRFRGKYSLAGSTYTYQRNRKENMTFGPNTNEITWINKDRFYYTGREGAKGPVIYTYWQRLPAEKKKK